MFKSASILAGLEVGTSKVCAVVGEITDSGNLNIVGVGQSKSRGVRKGEIIDAAAAAEDVRNAVADAEQKADAEIRHVFLGVTGSHIRGFNNRGFHPVAAEDREIAEDDVQDAIKNAKAINLPAENQALHLVRQHFLIDGLGGIREPAGMFGARLEVDVHVVHGNRNRFLNPQQAAQGLQLEIEGLVFNGLASALAMLNPQQKELGALVIDLGAGTTDYALYSEGVVKMTGVLAVGGDHVTNDIACGLKIPLGRAEQLKIEHGAALLDQGAKAKTIRVAKDLGDAETSVSVEHLRRIMSLRLEEIFELIAREVEMAGYANELRSGLFLCGGGARVADIRKLGEQVFGLPITLGSANSMSGLKSALDQPELATAIGLVKYGSLELRRRSSAGRGFAGGWMNAVGQFFRRGHATR